MDGARKASWLACATALLAGWTLAPAGRADAQEPVEPISVSGVPIVGATLTAQVGVPLGTGFQWQRCDADPPQLCVDISGATGPSYVVQHADVGYRLRVVAAGAVESKRTAIVPRPPEITAVRIDGRAIVGRTLTAGADVDGAATVTYEWLSCDASNGCPTVIGAGDSYVVEPKYLGQLLAVRATATGPDGGDSERSALTDPVQQAPAITAVTITGTAIVGQRLTADATATGDPTPAIAFQWLRCGPLLPPACDPIDGATGTSYDVAPADAGFRLAVRARAENPAGDDTGRSSLSDVVPEPPGRGASFDQTGTPPTTTAGSAVLPTGAALRYLRPFPVVRIKGLLVAGGARVTLLRVTAPRGSTVRIRCKRAGCPLRRKTVGVGRIRALERFLPAGVRITITVSKPGLVGKHVRIAIRDGRPPARRDSCLLPGRMKPATCPSS